MWVRWHTVALRDGAHHLTNLPGFLSEKPDLTLTIKRSDLERTMMGAKTLEAQLEDGTAKLVGDVSIRAKLAALMVDFDACFEITPGTRPPRARSPTPRATRRCRATIAE